MKNITRILCTSLMIFALALGAGFCTAAQATAEKAPKPVEQEALVDTSSVTEDGLSGSDALPDESAGTDGDATEAGKESSEQEQDFSYVHDPRTNPLAMQDIVENPDAVYGFSPDPESKRLGSYAEYDWTDPAFVALAREERIEYHESMETLTDIIFRMRDEGATIEEMARAVSAERNRLRMASYEDMPEAMAKVKESNLATYGHEDGPTAEELYEQYGSWTTVMQKAFSSNMGMDACCGLYDEYYLLYVELGYVEPDPAEPDVSDYSYLDVRARFE